MASAIRLFVRFFIGFFVGCRPFRVRRLRLVGLVFGRLGLFFLLISRLLALLLFVFGFPGGFVARFSLRVGGLEFARETDGQRIFLVRRFELLLTPAKLRHDLVDQLRILRGLEQHGFFQTGGRRAGKHPRVRQQQIVHLTGQDVLGVHGLAGEGEDGGR